jgi:hypothetical protein
LLATIGIRWSPRSKKRLSELRLIERRVVRVSSKTTDMKHVATPPKYSAAYWRELADHALARADVTASPNARLRGLKIVRIYEELAESERKLEGDTTGIALKENRGSRGH